MKHTIVKAKHERDYTVIANETIQDHALDYHALGFLVFLISKPDDWQISTKALAKERQVSVRTIRRLFLKLIDVGYVHREVIRRNDKGKFQTGTIYIVFEKKAFRREWREENKTEYDRIHALDDVPF